jgi:hypothetical protein
MPDFFLKAISLSLSFCYFKFKKSKQRTENRGQRTEIRWQWLLNAELGMGKGELGMRKTGKDVGSQA